MDEKKYKFLGAQVYIDVQSLLGKKEQPKKNTEQKKENKNNSTR